MIMELSNDRLAEICTTLFAVATEGLFIVGQDSKIILMNPAAEEMFGYQRSELIGQPISVLIPQEKREKHVGHMKGYHQKPARRKMGMGMDLNGVKKDGSFFPVEISLSRFEFDDQPWVMALVTDISTRKASELEVMKAKEELEKKVRERTKELEESYQKTKRAEQEIQKAYEQEKELNELKSRFVSMASHEFKTPLANILTSATLIDKYQKEDQSENRTKHVKKIKKSVSNLNAILNDFLSLDRVESGNVNVNASQFDLVALCEETIDQLDLLLKEGQQIKLDHSISSLEVHLDQNAMKHIIANLLSNAVKYSGENSTVTLRLKVEGNQLEIEVKDQGIRIPEEEQKNMFSKFFRAKNSLNIQGTGLGLHIIKYYVELMKGEISFSSQEGEGTSFFIRLPIKSKNS